ncbi:MAG: GNAT family N-acetyltransferase [Anaerolineae bacterium]|nr:GNAT family N-acetyltransferase [Anaerolineae bacterium]
MQLTVYRDEGGFKTLQGEWDDLVQRSTFNTIFLTWEWQTTWWQTLGKGDLWLLAWRDPHGTLVGLAPLYLNIDGGQRTLSLVGCREVSDYLDLIIAAGCEAEVYDAFLAWLAGPDAPSWDVVDLCNLPETSQSYRQLVEEARGRGFAAETMQEDVCPIVPLPSSWDGYLAGLDKHQRHEVRRKMRRIGEEATPRWYIVGPEHDLRVEMDAFIELHQRSRREKGEFMDETMQRFFHDMAQVMHDEGWLFLAFMEVNGVKVASMLCFDYHNSILVYNSGYDPEAYSSLSPGIVLLARCMEYAIGQRRRAFDFLQGNEVYKYRFGGKDFRVMRAVITASTPAIHE